MSATCWRGCNADWPASVVEGAGVRQSRAMSVVEAMANVMVGYGIAVLTQLLVFPAVGLSASLEQNLAMAAPSPP